MRLGDFDALKETLHNFFDGKVIDEPAYILRDVFYHIDSAPTIPLPDFKDFKEGYRQAIIDGKANFRSRPKGEWIEKQDKKGGWIECDKCGHEPLRDFSLDVVLSNYCPNCGANMRKGGAV